VMMATFWWEFMTFPRCYGEPKCRRRPWDGRRGET
jgi:hypothetical protein